MKRALAGLALLLCVTAANAFDRWVDDKYKGGETVFTSGIAQLLVVGARGVGLAINPNTDGLVVTKEITLKIDDNPAQTLPVQHIVISTYQIKGTEKLREMVANAKRVEIQYNLCNGTANGCAFTYKGNPKTVVWEFDTPLSTQFPDYKTIIELK